MSRLHLLNLTPREKLLNVRHRFLPNIPAARPLDKQRRTLEANIVFQPVWKVRHVVQVITQNLERNTELERVFSFGPDEVCQEELADGQTLRVAQTYSPSALYPFPRAKSKLIVAHLFILLQNLIRFLLLRNLRLLNLLHTLDIFRKIRRQRYTNRRIIHRYDCGN